MLLASGKSQDLSQGNASPSRAKRVEIRSLCHTSGSRSGGRSMLPGVQDPFNASDRGSRCHANEPFENRQERRPSPVSSTRIHSKLLDLDPRLPPMVPVDDYCKWATNQLDQASQSPQDNGSSMTESVHLSGP
ncbi:hypothetical protein GE21DRAFT_5751 [Neurospora crassa]|uniref:Uncharacterized protein n=1 Tax=Neurospora crassa (strain ATCC 24698 / 74-OR23-1A / CBS 708.71 / DSM 1257 / FGSC 987) TaxID=367110 RepID=Q7S9M5_NEUCR|nr:hypothetical protein NCU07676 [Neurospora crassa OR74A]EAA33082.2 hypothetical protein NCU07676 [Neurospora crassa OR74A]KHE84746.1 hypothetical protein GE21DRAFT_5751 [Neurospora crassa]|eukprot:XP_962318.2 hypothetical protein NCU07676 [Neurospora crassa OR74A]